jgi:amino acid permease
MAVILVYVVIVLLGDAVAVVIAGKMESISQSASLITFFVLFALIFWVGWILAVRITEKFITTE